jgi:hypothetical protein
MAVWHDVLRWAVTQDHRFYLAALDLSVRDIVKTNVNLSKAEEIEVSGIHVLQVY